MTSHTDEDDIEASRAPLIEHLTELRSRLIWSLWGFAGTTIFCFVFARQIFDILTGPLRGALLDRGWSRA
ncbi:MAG: twin-arginine translocase subunit TatC [Albimonas sp.]|uniref:twin-arginine translocase subunit TatC n=1 Tax=Albimonas sp. TaxID=1872425 RepID=UPI004055C7AB